MHCILYDMSYMYTYIFSYYIYIIGLKNSNDLSFKIGGYIFNSKMYMDIYCTWVLMPKLFISPTPSKEKSKTDTSITKLIAFMWRILLNRISNTSLLRACTDTVLTRASEDPNGSVHFVAMLFDYSPRWKCWKHRMILLVPCRPSSLGMFDCIA